jgi:hypothetical protein
MCLQGFAQLFAAAVEMGSNCAYGQVERVGNLLVGTLLLMIEDEDCSLDLAETLEVLFYCLLKLALLDLLLGVAAGMGETVLPAGDVVRYGDMGAVVAAAALPLVLSYVDGDSGEVGGEEGFAAKAGEGTVETEEDLLGEVVEVFPAACEAQEGAEDHRLVVVYDLLEGEIGLQGRLDQRVRLKFHPGE